ncbi:MAG: signal peptide peptidase SppA, partial [Mariprofundaceae bacterium]|nr:signal peptide peptidase SppA [Mariprofundaceae bacterium]
GDIVEEIEVQSGFPPDFSASGQTRLEDIVRVLRAAKQDKRISGLLLDFRELDQVSLPALQTLGRELRDFRQGGKAISAYADQYSQTQYLAAANADELWLHPMGMVLLTGMSSYRNYFADALKRMHVDIHLFRAGSYKSAAEPLVRNDMSDAAREETQAALDQLWAAIKLDVSHARGIDPASLQAMLDDPNTAISPYAGDPAALAKGMHLVDRIGTHGEWIQSIRGNAEQIGFSRYRQSLPSADHEGSGAKIGILTASGMITDSGLSAAGLHGEDFVELVDMAIEDDAIKAVVLRIDSPGGSVQASETMRRALSRLREAGKPLVVSMAGMAASGGYWIAAEADEIWTSPTTLTGSIGVFGVFPNMADALQNLGIHSDGVGTTAIAGGMRPDRPLPQAVSDVLQSGVDHVYTTFIGIVAKGRNMPADKVAQLAEGRVWTGADAVRLGLADQLGDLNDAIAAAASRAG